MAFARSDAPVAILTLLQTPTPTGVQFATLAPAYLDSLRRNTYMYLPQGYSLDADIPAADYFRNEDSPEDLYYEIPWDLLYETVGTTGRQLTPWNGAMLSPIGNKSATDFDNLGLEDLRGRVYTTRSIDLGNNSGNLASGFTFAIKTGLNRYAKVRITKYWEYENDAAKELALEIYVYK
jgi:hypothetical protein